MFNSIPANWIEVGKALKKEIFDYIKSNFDNHESRLNVIEIFNNSVEIFNFEVIGYVNNYSAQELTGIGTYKCNSNLSISNVKLTLLNSVSCPSISSSTGVLSLELEKSVDNGISWSSILLTRPEIKDGVSATGSESADFLFVENGELLNIGDLLRCSIASKKVSQGSFLISVYADVRE